MDGVQLALRCGPGTGHGDRNAERVCSRTGSPTQALPAGTVGAGAAPGSKSSRRGRGFVFSGLILHRNV